MLFNDIFTDFFFFSRVYVPLGVGLLSLGVYMLHFNRYFWFPKVTVPFYTPSSNGEECWLIHLLTNIVSLVYFIHFVRYIMVSCVVLVCFPIWLTVLSTFLSAWWRFEYLSVCVFVCMKWMFISFVYFIVCFLLVFRNSGYKSLVENMFCDYLLSVCGLSSLWIMSFNEHRFLFSIIYCLFYG